MSKWQQRRPTEPGIYVYCIQYTSPETQRQKWSNPRAGVVAQDTMGEMVFTQNDGVPQRIEAMRFGIWLKLPARPPLTPQIYEED